MYCYRTPAPSLDSPQEPGGHCRAAEQLLSVLREGNRASLPCPWGAMAQLPAGALCPCWDRAPAPLKAPGCRSCPQGTPPFLQDGAARLTAHHHVSLQTCACRSTAAPAHFGSVCAAFPALLHVVPVRFPVQDSEQQQGRDGAHNPAEREFLTAHSFTHSISGVSLHSACNIPSHILHCLLSLQIIFLCFSCF